MNPNMQHPLTCILFGPSCSGKFVLTLKQVQHAQQVLTPTPERIIYCYGECHKIFDKYSNVEFHDGLPNLNVFDGKNRTLLVLDDLMTNTYDNLACQMYPERVPLWWKHSEMLRYPVWVSLDRSKT